MGSLAGWRSIYRFAVGYETWNRASASLVCQSWSATRRADFKWVSRRWHGAGS